MGQGDGGVIFTAQPEQDAAFGSTAHGELVSPVVSPSGKHLCWGL